MSFINNKFFSSTNFFSSNFSRTSSTSGNSTSGNSTSGNTQTSNAFSAWGGFGSSLSGVKNNSISNLVQPLIGQLRGNSSSYGNTDKNSTIVRAYGFNYGSLFGGQSYSGWGSFYQNNGGSNHGRTLNGGFGNDVLTGTDSDQVLNGNFGNDTLDGGAGNDTINGGFGNDIISDDQGNNTINGGFGRDTLKLGGNIADYSISRQGSRFFLYNNQTGNRNTVNQVERFIFRDIDISARQLEKLLQQKVDLAYHSVDGSFNNLQAPDLGKADSPFVSIMPKDSSRSIGGTTEVNLPNPREVSNAVAAQDTNTENAKGLSDMFWLWGQFLDHDINLTPVNADDSADIPIPAGDAWFDPAGTGAQTMGFDRSVSLLDDNGNRSQTNHITAWIDGSNVYGSSEEAANSLRAFSGGKLLIGDNGMLPKGADGFYMAGDERANENVGLTSMHTLWMREHNRIADELALQNPEWSDEELFQNARNQVVAEIQAITSNEFLPGLLGNDTLKEYSGYDSTVSPQISSAFATAAYRLGHTMLSPTILRLDEQGNEIPEGNLQLRDAFFQPDKVSQAGIEPVLRGFASHTAQAVDPMLVDDVRNFLFGPPGAGGFDLASLNLQRGRDHELPGLNDAREALGLPRIGSFDDPVFKGDFGQKLASVYDSPDDVDLWIGGLAEQEQGDSLVGPTFTAILKDQFERLRDADRFWYENSFSGAELAELNSLTLSDVIKRNTDIQNIQDNVMVASNVHMPLSEDISVDATSVTAPVNSTTQLTDTVSVSAAEAEIIATSALDALNVGNITPLSNDTE